MSCRPFLITTTTVSYPPTFGKTLILMISLKIRRILLRTVAFFDTFIVTEMPKREIPVLGRNFKNKKSPRTVRPVLRVFLKSSSFWRRCEAGRATKFKLSGACDLWLGDEIKPPGRLWSVGALRIRVFACVLLF